MNAFYSDKLRVEKYDTRREMGEAAAKQAAYALREAVAEKGYARAIFAAAPSQNEFLAALCVEDVPWEKIDAYHMDEYIGLPTDAPQGFANFLRRAIFERVPFRSVNCMNGQCACAEDECARYGSLVDEAAPDFTFMGIGENGHIAFNDPHVADFNDPATCKVVSLDDTCRMQQVHDGAFARFEDVPARAMTLTVPALLHAKRIFCVVPAATKAEAVLRTLRGAIGAACPATALRNHPNATLYIDADSAGRL